jgi:serine protease Do
MAKTVVDQLRDTGKVTRGYLGVRFQPLTADLAKSFGLDSDKGALITSVEKDTPAERADLKAGDVILEYDGKAINDGNELPRYVAATPVDKKVKLVIFRDGKRQDVSLLVGTLKDAQSGSDAGVSSQSDKIGMTVEELKKNVAERLGIRDVKGLLISEVKPGSAAEEAGVSPGSIVIEINGQRPETLSAFNTAISRLKKGDVMRLLLRRVDGGMHYVAVKVE